MGSSLWSNSQHLRSDHGTQFRNSTSQDFWISKGISHKFFNCHNSSTKWRCWETKSDSHLSWMNYGSWGWSSTILLGRSYLYSLLHSNLIYHCEAPWEKCIWAVERKKTWYLLLSCLWMCLYILNQRYQHSKFEVKADEGIFLGYSSVYKAFIVFFFNTISWGIHSSYAWWRLLHTISNWSSCFHSNRAHF